MESICSSRLLSYKLSYTRTESADVGERLSERLQCSRELVAKNGSSFNAAARSLNFRLNFGSSLESGVSENGKL